jgi:hypothetical protein
LFQVDQFRGVEQLNQANHAKLLPGRPVQIVPRGTIVLVDTGVGGDLRRISVIHAAGKLHNFRGA